MKKQNGITLIALVITVIVLLLLAGVTISLVVGDSGIISQATKATLETREEQVIEDVTMAWASADSEYFSAWSKEPTTRKSIYFNREKLNNYLKGKGEVVSEVNYDPDSISTLEYKPRKPENSSVYSLEIDSEGRVTVANSKSNKDFQTEVQEETIAEGGLWPAGVEATAENQITTWQELISSGDVKVYGTSLYEVNPNLTGHLIIPNEITGFSGSYMFEYSKLTELTIPSTLTYFNYYTFTDSEFSKINYLGTMKQWCEFRFDGYNNETYDTNPAEFTDELYINGELVGENLVLEEGIEKINSFAFYGYKKLKSVTIPASVQTINSSAFFECTNLTNFVVESDNEKFAAVDGVLYTKNMETLLYYPTGKAGTTFDIPNTVTSIGTYAFCSNKTLTQVTIPSSVTKIGNYGFYGVQLTQVTIPSSLTTIGSSAFANTKITSIEIPDNITSIGSNAFNYCTKLSSVTIGNGVKAIGSGMFSGCDSLKNITIGNSVKTIGVQAFYNCKNLTSIIIPSNVTSIERSAFEYCTNLLNIIIPTSVTTIEEDAFNNTAWITARRKENPLVVVNGILIDGETATGVVTIPNNVNTIGEYAFYQSKITELTIPGTVKTIKDSAFFRCYSLTTVTIEKGLEKIGYGIFGQANSEVKIYFKGTEAEWKAISGSSSYTSKVVYVTE